MHILPKSQRRLAVFLINMDSATKRLADMTARLDAMGLKAERVPGVNGRELNYPIPEFSEISYMLMHGRRTSPPEIGCYLSHVACAINSWRVMQISRSSSRMTWSSTMIFSTP